MHCPGRNVRRQMLSLNMLSTSELNLHLIASKKWEACPAFQNMPRPWLILILRKIAANRYDIFVICAISCFILDMILDGFLIRMTIHRLEHNKLQQNYKIMHNSSFLEAICPKKYPLFQVNEAPPAPSPGFHVAHVGPQVAVNILCQRFHVFQPLLGHARIGRVGLQLSEVMCHGTIT